jgi:predicted transposase YbfD/YdcC
LFETFADYFDELKDPRSREGLHEFDEVLFLATCATIAGADGPSDIEEFGHHQLAWLRKYVRFANGVPSHDTIGRLFELIKPNKFQEAFLNWIHSFRLDEPSNGELTTLAIDGKTERGSRTAKKNPLHVVSAWATEYGLTLGQKAVESKSNEITAIPGLLQTLELRGKIVSIDAMGCQKEIAKNIVQDGGEYCLAVKENQPKLFEAIEAFFESVADDEQVAAECLQHETNDRSRGREEYRHYMITKLPKEMSEFKKSWHNLTSIGRCLSFF